MTCEPSRYHDWSGLRFPRTRTDSQWVEMERTSIPEPWVSVILNWAGLLAFFVAVWMVC